MASFIRVLLLEVQRQRRRRRGGRMYTEVARWDARMRMKMGKEARWEYGGRNERVGRQQMMLVGSTTDGDASARLRTGSGVGSFESYRGAHAAKLTVLDCCTLPACALQLGIYDVLVLID